MMQIVQITYQGEDAKMEEWYKLEASGLYNTRILPGVVLCDFQLYL